MRAPRWWPFEMVTASDLTETPCLIVHLPRNTELFVWWERGPRTMIKRWEVLTPKLPRPWLLTEAPPVVCKGSMNERRCAHCSFVQCAVPGVALGNHTHLCPRKGTSYLVAWPQW